MAHRFVHSSPALCDMVSARDICLVRTRLLCQQHWTEHGELSAVANGQPYAVAGTSLCWHSWCLRNAFNSAEQIMDVPILQVPKHAVEVVKVFLGARARAAGSGTHC